MRDPRIEKLADVIVNYSTAVKRGELVRLTGDPVAMPLLEAIYEKAIKAGANVELRIAPDSFEELFYTNASDQQLGFLSPLALDTIEKIDVSITIWAHNNSQAMANVDPRKQAMASVARRPMMKRFMERSAEGKLRWVGTLYPTASSAQDAGMGTREYEDFVFRAGLLHMPDPVAAWNQLKVRQQRLVDALTGTKMLHFTTPQGTDLKVNVDGMTWVNCAGDCNFPDGEVFTGPNLKAADGGVNGVVQFSFPAAHGGREVHNARLVFERGKVIQATATAGQDYLRTMLEQDPGASYLGEIAIGTNYGITRYTKNGLLDEKIGGTFHAAVGAGYPETGNNNVSALHWDMVRDLRQGGKALADGRVIVDNGVIDKAIWPAD